MEVFCDLWKCFDRMEVFCPYEPPYALDKILCEDSVTYTITVAKKSQDLSECYTMAIAYGICVPSRSRNLAKEKDVEFCPFSVVLL